MTQVLASRFQKTQSQREIQKMRDVQPSPFEVQPSTFGGRPRSFLIANEQSRPVSSYMNIPNLKGHRIVSGEVDSSVAKRKKNLFNL